MRCWGLDPQISQITQIARVSEKARALPAARLQTGICAIGEICGEHNVGSVVQGVAMPEASASVTTSNRTMKRSGNPFGGGRERAVVAETARRTESSQRLLPEPERQVEPRIRPDGSTLSSTSATKASSAMPSGRSHLDRMLNSTKER